MNVLITGAWNCTKEHITEIEKNGHRVYFLQYEGDSLPCAYEKVEAVIGNSLFLHHSIERFVNLKFIQLTSAGFDRIPMHYVKEHRIEIRNARGVYSIPMAEFAVSGVLQIYKKKDYFHKNQIEHRWKKNRGLLELYGKTVCIVGCGSVGCTCAERFAAFGCRVIGVDLLLQKTSVFNEMYPVECLNEKLSESDVVVLTLPLTDQTRNLMNEKSFSYMRQDSVLVNIARGGVIDTDALLRNLKDKLYGAVLDVFEEEPLDVRNPLWDMKNVVLTPHNSFVGDGNDKRLAELIMKNMEQL